MGATAAAALIAATVGCFERGRAKPRPADDAAARAPVAVVDAAPTPGAAGLRPPNGARDAAGAVRVRLEAEPAHLNPLFRGEAIATRVAMGDVYEGLLCAERVGERPRSCLAERVEITDADTVWTFYLRRDVRWHDGRPFRARDVAFTLGLLAGKSRASSILAADFDDATAVDVVDRHTVRVVFSGLRVGRRSAFAAVPILPAHVFGNVPRAKLATAAASRAPVGTGPFKVDAWTAGESIALVRNDSYWGAPARVARVVYELMPSRQRAVAALRAGELDVILQMPIDEARAAVDTDASLQLFAYDSPAYLAAVWNTRRPALTDPRVRRGLGMLLDRAGIVDQVFKGYARYLDGPYTGVCDMVNPGLPFDRAEAAKLLGTASPTVTLLVPTESRTMQRIADIWASDAAPHATLQVATAPFGEVLARARRGEFDAVLLGFTTGVDVDHYAVFHSSQTDAQNYGGLADTELDAVLEQIRATPNAAARTGLERKAHSRIVELQPFSFIASDQRVGLARAPVGGIAVTADGFAARRVWIAQ